MSGATSRVVPANTKDARRAVSLALVGCGLVALLVAGGALHGGAAATYTGRSRSVALLPVVSPSGTAATVWNCAGPLEATPAKRPAVLLENPSGRPASVRLLIAATAVGGGRPEQRLPGRSASAVVAPRSSVRYLLPAVAAPHKAGAPVRRGVVVEEAVSVTALHAPVTATEQLPTASGTLSSPCSPGSAAGGYEAAGVTTGSSTVELALYDPTAAPAVVDVTVGTGNGPVQPAPYQGISLSPGALFVIHLGRFVPLRPEVAVSAHATVGRFTLGVLSSVDARFVTSRVGPGHSYLETGGTLLSGVGRPLRRFVMPYGVFGASDAEAVRLFDPGNRPAEVTLAGSSGRLSVTVLPGHTVSAALPLAGAGSAGVETVSSNVGIVCEQETYVTTSPGHVQLVAAPLLAAGAERFVIPAGPGVDQRGVVLLTATAGHEVTVDLDRAPAPGRPAVLLGQRILRPGSETAIPLGRAAVGTLEVTGDGPFAVGGFLVSPSGSRSSLSVIPVMGR